jgi:ATPase subunit of ABC transporter with duplicated ATPase domains
MAKQKYYHNLVHKQDAPPSESNDASRAPSRRGSEKELSTLDHYIATTSEFSSLSTHIEFKNVHFSYPSRPKKKIFDDFNLAIIQGQTVALVGTCALLVVIVSEIDSHIGSPSGFDVDHCVGKGLLVVASRLLSV